MLRCVKVDLPQCDATKPVCQKCAKSRRICLDKSDVIKSHFPIHFENPYASGDSKRPRGPRASLTILAPQVDWESRALAYYRQYHLQTVTEVTSISGGLAECVAEWAASGKVNIMVDLALSSMALAIFSRTQRNPTAAVQATSNYQRLLATTQDQISRLSLQTSDEGVDSCLLAAFLMSRFEGANQGCAASTKALTSFESLSAWSHHDGAMAILRHWFNHPRRGPPSFIVQRSRRGLLRSSLLRNRPLPAWMKDGSIYGEYGVELDFDRIIVQIIGLLHRIQKLRQSNGKPCSEVARLRTEARELDTALDAWAAQIPPDCTYEKRCCTENSPRPRLHWYSSAVSIHRTSGNAAAWCHYFAVRMLINNARLKVLAITSEGPIGVDSERETKTSSAQLNAAAEDLAASIPACLELVPSRAAIQANGLRNPILKKLDVINPSNASLTAWPLTIASSLEQLDSGQKAWFKAELAEIGRITGDGILEFADTNEWTTI